ncbi:hypothetical protein AAMO2058_001018300 [Amorphochlora amoebiformis]
MGQHDSSNAPDSKKSRPNESDLLLTPKSLKTAAFSICSARSFARDDFAQRTIDWISVAFISYFNVCGGPWGSEAIISAAGPLPGLVGVVIFACVIGLPMVFVTSELSAMFPDDGGYSIWVAEAFGEFWGFQESYFSWISGLLDNALYPVITYRLIEALVFPEGLNFFFAWACKAVLVLAFSIPNFFLVNAVGRGLMFAFCIVMFPFAIISINALIHPGDFHQLLKVRTDEGGNGPDWSKLINLLYWNVSGFDCISTCSGEVKDPGKSFIRGLMSCLGLVVLTYLIPLSLAATQDTPPWYSWHEGDFSVIASKQVGTWLGGILIFSGAVGNMGMHVAELFEDTWQLHGMAKCGLAPQLFAYKHPTHRTPVLAVAFSVTLMVIVVALPFERLMMADNFFSVSGGILELLAFIKLRISRPNSHRPFKMPLNFWGSMIPVFVCISVSVTVLLTSFFRDLCHIIVDSSAIVVGLILYLCVKCSASLRYTRRKRSSRRSYLNTPPVHSILASRRISALSENQNILEIKRSSSSDGHLRVILPSSTLATPAETPG